MKLYESNEMPKNTRISAVLQGDIITWLRTIAKREGFNFTQTLNWILRKAKENDDAR